MQDEPTAILIERYLHRMLTAGNLAIELDVSPSYVSAMKRWGFKMPGGKASVAMARKFLADCPDFGVRETICKKPKT